jgi:hypothetical protein
MNEFELFDVSFYQYHLAARTRLCSKPKISNPVANEPTPRKIIEPRDIALCVECIAHHISQDLVLI